MLGPANTLTVATLATLLGFAVAGTWAARGMYAHFDVIDDRLVRIEQLVGQKLEAFLTKQDLKQFARELKAANPTMVVPDLDR